MRLGLQDSDRCHGWQVTFIYAFDAGQFSDRGTQRWGMARLLNKKEGEGVVAPSPSPTSDCQFGYLAPRKCFNR